MTILRSLLFVPGNKESMLAKAVAVAPDAFVPDMEDSVPPAEKAAARATIAQWLPRLAAAGRPVIPRVNSLDTDWLEADLEAVVGAHIYGVSVGKIRTAADIAAIVDVIAALERRANLPAGAVKLVPWLETAEALVHCDAICRASERIVAVAFGGEDFAHDMGVERLADPAQMLYARSRICIAARAARILALDTPYFTLRDADGLRADADAAKALGFKGKFAIHPEQVRILNECFAPSPREIAQAQRIVEAYEAAERAGRGSTALDGSVIDIPVVKRARAVLALAQRLSTQG